MNSEIKVCESAAILMVVLILLISCSKDRDGWQGSIEVVDEVTVVNNPKEPLYEENSAIYITDVRALRRSQSVLGSKVRALEIETHGYVEKERVGILKPRVDELYQRGKQWIPEWCVVLKVVNKLIGIVLYLF